MDFNQFKKEWAEAMVHNLSDEDLEDEMHDLYIEYKDGFENYTKGSTVKEWCEFFHFECNLEDHSMRLKSKIHTLKTWTEYFEKVVSGEKGFEVRKQDRDFQVGDQLYLREYVPDGPNKGYTGRTTYKQISYKLEGGSFGIEKGFCVLGLKATGQI